MIETQHLGRVFDGTVAVEDVSFSIKDGEAFAFLGPNGAGKTTTVRMLCCLIGATSGTGYIDGLDIREKANQLKIRSMIGLLPENPGMYESLSAHRNLDFYARLYGVPEREREERISSMLKRLGIYERRNDAVGKFSKGMKQKIAIARALMHEPSYIFLDEPTAALDPEAAITVRNFLLELKKEGRTIFLNTHNLDEAQRVCDRIGVLKTRLLATGTPDELASRFFGRSTMVRLKEANPDYMASLRQLPGVLDVKLDDRSILLSLVDPVAQNPLIISTLVSKGAQIEYVQEVKHGLEDIYLKLMGGSK
jgi:ABC-2 type transport system ATP-binding protein